MRRSRTSPPCGAWRCDGSRGDGNRGDASAHGALHGAEAEVRDAPLRAWVQDALARNEPPWVPFPGPSQSAEYAWQEQVPLPCVH